MKRIATLILLLLPALIFAQLSPIQIGSASNAFTILRTSQNQVAASDSLNTVLFIHRQDVGVWGGTGADNGRLRYDISTDGGMTFNNDIGVVNPTYTYPARYPNISLYNPAGNTNPANAKAIWVAPTLGGPTGSWGGAVVGTANVTSTNPATSTESYLYLNDRAYLPGGLCGGLPGEFWTCDFGFNGTTVIDSLYIYKGVWNSGTQQVVWSRVESRYLPMSLTFDGVSRKNGPSMAFSPDGTSGWIGFLGDLAGGHDSVYSPVLLASTNSGANWGAPIEVDLRNYSWIADSLQTGFFVGVDPTGKPVPQSSGNPTTTFDFDLTVDANGDPHFFTVVGTASIQDVNYNVTAGPAYSVYSGIAKFACDITSPNGGTSWIPRYIAPVLTLRATFGSGTNTVTQDNYPQISRTEDGSLLFYSWVDTDTSGGQFGSSANTFPDMYACAYRISDGFRTCYRNVTGGDPVWDNQIRYPTLAPTVLTSPKGWKVPAVSATFATGDPYGQTNFWYWGNELEWTPENFVGPATLNLAWDANGNCSNCPLDVSLTVIDETCAGTLDGSVTVAVSGGAGAYAYSWSNGNLGANLLNIAGGNYTLFISDATNCNYSYNANVNSPPGLNFTIFGNDPFCNGGLTNIFLSAMGGSGTLAYAWSNGGTTQNLMNVPAGMYSVTVTDNIGCSGDTSVTINEPPPIVVSANVSNPLCAGGVGAIDLSASGGTGTLSFLWSDGATTEDLLNVSEGTYTVTVTDMNGCTETLTDSVSGPLAIVLDLTISHPPCAGDNGSVTLNVSGGAGSVGLVWSNGATTQSLASVPAGSYTVTAVDANGCTEMATAIVIEPTPINMTIAATDETTAGANDGTAFAILSGGTPPYTYSWSNGATVDAISGLAPGVYTLTATDANGCMLTEAVTVLAGPVGIDELSLKGIDEFRVFPNPSDGLFRLELVLEQPEYVFLQVFSPEGKLLIYHAEDHVTSLNKTLDLRSFAAGDYVLVMQVKGARVVRHLLVR